MVTLPPSASLSQKPRSSASSSPLSEMVMLLPSARSMLRGRVGAHQGQPAGGLQLAVHDLVGLVLADPGHLHSPKVLRSSSPPKTDW